MALNRSTVPSLRRVFHEGFCARDVAEPLVSFDADAPADTVRAFMAERKYEIVGIRERGLVVGYVEQAALEDGACSAFLRRLDDARVMLDSTPLVDVVLGLSEARRLFVSVLGGVSGIITRSDLQKPPVRMWLFGMVTLIEMRFARLIEAYCPDGQWKEFLSEGRIAKAESLLAERARRNQELDLLDCLQFSDKTQIIARNPELRGLTRFESRRQIEQFAKQLEQLRNNLAHAQDIVTTDWETIVLLAANLDRVLLGPPGLESE